jgi:hypothetical protein
MGPVVHEGGGPPLGSSRWRAHRPTPGEVWCASWPVEPEPLAIGIASVSIIGMEFMFIMGIEFMFPIAIEFMLPIGIEFMADMWLAISWS